MKYIACFFLFLSTVFFQNELSAQSLTKEEVKQIKAELKKFKKNPLLYKLKITKLRKECDDKDEDIDNLEGRLKKSKRVIKTLNDSIALMHNAIDILVEEMEAGAVRSEQNEQPLVDQKADNTNTVSSNNTNTSYQKPAPKGLVYEVQVGNFKNFDLTDYFDSPKVFSFDKYGDSYVYHIGHFDSYDKARQFAEDMKKLGINDAFVTKYRNGKRID